MELAETHVKETMTASPNRGTTVDTSKPQRKRATKEYLEKEMWRKKYMDSRIQVQLEEDGGGSTRQSWMETGVYGLCLESSKSKSQLIHTFT